MLFHFQGLTDINHIRSQIIQLFQLIHGHIVLLSDAPQRIPADRFISLSAIGVTCITSCSIRLVGIRRVPSFANQEFLAWVNEVIFDIVPLNQLIHGDAIVMGD